HTLSLHDALPIWAGGAGGGRTRRGGGAGRGERRAAAVVASDPRADRLQWTPSMGWLRNKVFAVATRALTKPRGNYTLLLPNDFDALLGVIRPGDVILVDGDQRVSQVIKYLTQSTWSHSVLYVGEIGRAHV